MLSNCRSLLTTHFIEGLGYQKEAACSVRKVISVLAFKHFGFFIKNMYNKSLTLLSYTKEITNGIYKADSKR